jgi:hypothetical protein
LWIVENSLRSPRTGGASGAHAAGKSWKHRHQPCSCPQCLWRLLDHSFGLLAAYEK